MKIKRKKDGSYIIDFNGAPFHVTSSYPTEEQYGKEFTFDYIDNYAKTHAEDVEDYVPVCSTISEFATSEEKAQARIASLQSTALSILPAIQAGIDRAENEQLLTDIMLEIEELKGNI